VAKAKKFGAFSGVFTPSILTILGVIMFLRLPWIVGQAGLWSTLGIILVAHVISASTGLSVASVATDKRVESGGSYYIISRSLGLPIGGTLGLALFVGLSFSVSLYLIGFAETFLGYFGMEVTLQSIRIAGSIILAVVAILTFISTSLAIKTQYLIMTAMVLSLVSIFFGSHDVAPAYPQLSTIEGALPWIALFAIFFPAVTGFEAGVSMSGDLKDARKDIPFGTIGAILVGLVVYIGLAVFFSFTVDRSQLIGNPAVLFDISWLPQLVVAGILGATLSSALGSILGAPRILQAVAADRIFPAFFSKGYGASNEPRNALLLTYLIAQAGILIGELNVIARIVTIFFIITYGFLNITYAVESWAGSDFRPSFKIPRFVSIFGALACIIVMIQLDVVAMIGASLVLIAIFLFLKKKELTLQTGDTWNSIWASLVKSGLSRLATSSREPRNWRPNVILFSGGDKKRPHLLEMGKALVGKLGIFTNFELQENPSSETSIAKDQQIAMDTAGRKNGVFTRRHICTDIYDGIDSISRIYGFSGFEPNTILMGWGRNTRNPEKFARLLNNFRKLDYNTALLHYDHQKGFGQYRRIDFWWSGRGRNLSLALTLVRFITSSEEWRNARIRIMVINRDSSQTENYYSLIQQLVDNYRISADIKVINNGVEQLPENSIIHAESRDTDLTILELPEWNRREVTQVIDKTNLMTENLRTCLIINASSFFDEINVATPIQESSRLPEETPGMPLPEVVPQLKLSHREIIANEVYNVAGVYTDHAREFYTNTMEPIRVRHAELYNGIHEAAATTLGNLQKTFSLENSKDQNKEFLRLLNDFSYHSTQQIVFLKEQTITLERDVLEKTINKYLAAVRHSVSMVPEKIRIRLPGKDFAITPGDGFATRFYKVRKRLQAAITRRPVVHSIRVTPPPDTICTTNACCGCSSFCWNSPGTPLPRWQK
jgi:amino acid transporter